MQTTPQGHCESAKNMMLALCSDQLRLHSHQIRQGGVQQQGQAEVCGFVGASSNVFVLPHGRVVQL